MTNIKKSLIFSALCVASIIIVLGYSAYGWMSMNNQVRAVGKNITVTVPENLHISLSPSDGWTSTLNVNMEDIVKQATSGDTTPFNPGGSERFYLLPASTYNGVNDTIWQTGQAKDNGAPADGAVFDLGHRIKWNASTTSFEGHFIDVPLYFRTDGEVDLKIALYEDTTAITPDTNNINKIVRVAFLNPACTASSMGNAEPLVLAGNESTGVFNGKVIKNATEKIPPKYLSYTNKLSKQLFTVAHDAVTQITVRIWIEGQDQNCVAKLGGQSFSVSLGFCAIDEGE